MSANLTLNVNPNSLTYLPVCYSLTYPPVCYSLTYLPLCAWDRLSSTGTTVMPAPRHAHQQCTE